MSGTRPISTTEEYVKARTNPDWTRALLFNEVSVVYYLPMEMSGVCGKDHSTMRNKYFKSSKILLVFQLHDEIFEANQFEMDFQLTQFINTFRSNKNQKQLISLY